MRRILIDSEFHAKVELFTDNLFSSAGGRFVNPNKGLERLKKSLFALEDNRRRKYLNKIIKDLPKLKKIKPNQFQECIKEFEAIIPYEEFRDDFAEKIISALRYDRLRETEYPNFIRQFTLKTCVYCNAMLTIVIDRQNTGKAKNNFEIDHFKAKSKYPFLAISYYNLFPCCGNCNRSKSKFDAEFNLYTENDTDLEAFSFSLTEECVVDYWSNLNPSNIQINFNTVNKNIEFLKNHNKLFHVQSIYDEQVDIAEELLQKSMAYNKASREGLVESFKSIFPDETMIKRLIIGNYTKPEEIHKRPMSKFTQDIARQLGLID